ncbi:MAG: hypothetical protein EA369_04875 [Bradymonadales bacterium]|nr:MAG: hypothetical protein EA369_04875 [Bradymonadales bacterium]
MARLTKKELKAPDELWKTSYSVYHWIKENWLLSLAVVVISFLALFFGLFWMEYQSQRETKAQHQYAEVASLFSQWQMEEEESDRARLQEQFSEAWESLQEAFPRSKAAGLASVFRANMKMELGDPQGALEDLHLYRRSLVRAHRDLAWYPIAVAHEELGETEDALKAFREVAKISSSSLRPWAILGEARSLRDLGRVDEALDRYQFFLTEFADTPEATKVRALIARLEGSG